MTQLLHVFKIWKAERPNSFFSFVKAKMKSNMNPNEHVALRTRATQSNKAHWKDVGEEFAKAKAKMKKLANTQIKTRAEMHEFEDYIIALKKAHCRSASNLVELYEPNMTKAQSKFMEGEWRGVDIADYLSKPVHWEQKEKVSVFRQLHLVHRSLDDPKQIAYYPTHRHFTEGREVRAKMGKYLTNYKEVFGLTDVEIKGVVEKYVAQVTGEGLWSLNYAGSNDPDAWEHIYKVGPDSCMSGGDSDCVRVYAHEESVLKLAYIEDGNNLILARCIVRTDDKKGYLRVYPDPNGSPFGRFILDALAADGYGNQINLDGVELVADDSDDGFVCPYIDSGYGGNQYAAYSNGMLVLGDGDLSCSNTNGYAQYEYESRCDSCGCGCDSDDLTYIEGNERDLCNSCLHDGYTLARTNNGRQWVGNDDVIYCESTDEHYDPDSTEYFNVYQCQNDNKWYSLDDLNSTMDGLIHSSYCSELDHPDGDGNNYAHEDNVTTLTDGTTCYDDDAADLQAEIDGLATEKERLAEQAEVEARQATLITVPTKSEYRELLEVA